MWWSPGGVLGEALTNQPTQLFSTICARATCVSKLFRPCLIEFFFVDFVVNDSLNWERKGASPPPLTGIVTLSQLLSFCA